MIPDFKTYIKESIWADIYDRSTGDSVRKEDDVNLISDRRDFVEYLKKHYQEMDIDGDGLCTIEWGSAQDYVSVPVLLNDNREYGDNRYYYLEFHDFSNSNRYIIFPYKIVNDIPNIYKVLLENYNIETIRSFNGNPQYLDITPKNSKKVTNKFFLDVLDLILDNAKKPILKMIEKVDVYESVWADIYDRSTGDSVRKEDDVNLLDQDGLYDYLNDHYVIINGGFNINYYKTMNYISVPVLQRKPNSTTGMCLVYEYHKYQSEIYLNSAVAKEDMFAILYNRLKNAYNVIDKHTGSLHITPKKGNITNKTFVELIDFIIENAKKRNLTIDRK